MPVAVRGLLPSFTDLARNPISFPLLYEANVLGISREKAGNPSHTQFEGDCTALELAAKLALIVAAVLGVACDGLTVRHSHLTDVNLQPKLAPDAVANDLEMQLWGCELR